MPIINGSTIIVARYTTPNLTKMFLIKAWKRRAENVYIYTIRQRWNVRIKECGTAYRRPLNFTDPATEICVHTSWKVPLSLQNFLDDQRRLLNSPSVVNNYTTVSWPAHNARLKWGYCVPLQRRYSPLCTKYCVPKYVQCVFSRSRRRNKKLLLQWGI